MSKDYPIRGILIHMMQEGDVALEWAEERINACIEQSRRQGIRKGFEQGVACRKKCAERVEDIGTSD